MDLISTPLKTRIRKHFFKRSRVFHSKIGRNAVSIGLRAIHLNKMVYRRAIKSSLKNSSLPPIPLEKGMLILDSKYASNANLNLNSVVLDSRSAYQSFFLNEGKHRSKKPYLLGVPIEKYLSQNSPMINLATNSAIVKVISDYLGEVPLLHSIFLRYSPNQEKIDSGSQSFHVDAGDTKMVKVFVAIDDVDNESGPLHVVPADYSKKVFSKIGKTNLISRLDDEFVESAISPFESIPIVGASGTVAFVDIARCFHYGSRPSKKPRLMLWLHYIRASAANYPLGIIGDRMDFSYCVGPETTTIKKAVLSPS